MLTLTQLAGFSISLASDLYTGVDDFESYSAADYLSFLDPTATPTFGENGWVMKGNFATLGYDNFEWYEDTTGLNNGVGFDGAGVVETTNIIVAYDTFETYTTTDNMNDGRGFSGAGITGVTGRVVAYDTFETYTTTVNMNDGRGFSSAFVVGSNA